MNDLIAVSKIEKILLKNLNPIFLDTMYEIIRIKVYETETKIVQIMIDHYNKIIDIEDCAKYSRLISKFLDNKKLISHDFSLEVSSPGLDRKFFKLEQFHEFIGHEIKVKFYDGNKKVTKIALLLNTNGEGIFLKDENEFFINFDKVIVARLEPIFEVSNE